MLNGILDFTQTEKLYKTGPLKFLSIPSSRDTSFILSTYTIDALYHIVVGQIYIEMVS